MPVRHKWKNCQKKETFKGHLKEEEKKMCKLDTIRIKCISIFMSLEFTKSRKKNMNENIIFEHKNKNNRIPYRHVYEHTHTCELDLINHSFQSIYPVW